MIANHAAYWAFAESVERGPGGLRARFDLLPDSKLEWLALTAPEDWNKAFAEIKPAILTLAVSGHDREELARRTHGTLRESAWYYLALGDEGVPASLYAELHAQEHDPAFIKDMQWIDGRTKFGHSLNTLFSMSDLVQGRNRELRAALPDLSKVATELRVGIYDVGQGSASAVCDGKNMPLVYFDLGGGCLGNSSTYRNRKQFCWSHRPPVVLSHWDYDHYFSGTFTEESWRSTWVVPSHRTVGPTARKMLASIMLAGGSVIVWDWAPLPTTVRVGPITLARPAPRSTSKNHCGIVLRVDLETEDDEKWPVLLVGDIGYDYLPPALTRGVVGLGASHHGGHRHVGRPPVATPPAIVVYSYGDGNMYRHPTSIAVQLHRNSGWRRKLDTPRGDVVLAPRPALHPVPCSGKRCGIHPTQQ